MLFIEKKNKIRKKYNFFKYIIFNLETIIIIKT